MKNFFLQIICLAMTAKKGLTMHIILRGFHRLDVENKKFSPSLYLFSARSEQLAFDACCPSKLYNLKSSEKCKVIMACLIFDGFKMKVK